MVYNERDGNRSTALPGVRGIKTFTNPGATAQRISTFIDGMPMTGPQATINFIDVAGVEVYRGPQSAVFGRSVINYTTRKPNHDEAQGGVRAEIGEDAKQALGFFYTSPIAGDKLSFSVAGSVDSYDGPGSVESTDGFKLGSRDTEYFSAALSYRPTDQLEVRVRYSTTSLDDGPAPDYNLDPSTDSNVTLSPTAGAASLYRGELRFIEDPVFGRNFCFGDDADEVGAFNCITDPGWELERDRLEFDVNYALQNGANLTFKAYTSEDTVFDIDDQDNTGFNTGFVVNMGTDTNIEEDYYEVIWTSPDENRLRYTLGASSYEYEFENIAYFIHPTSSSDGVGSAPSIGTQSVENVGIFAGLFYDINDNLTLALEGRQQNDKIVANDPDPTDSIIPIADTDTFLPRLSLSWTPNEDVTYYFQYAEGVQPASVNAGAVAPQQRATAAALEGLVVDGVTYSSAVPFLDAVTAVDEEELTNIEIGFKGRFMDGRLALNAALFSIETEGYAETANLFYFPAGSDSAAVLAALEARGVATGNPLLANLSETSLRVRGNVNIADLESTGLELDANYLATDNLQLQTTLTYLDTKFQNACVPVGADFGLPVSTLTLASGGTLSCSDASGNDFPYIPNIQLGLSATYTGELANGWGWFTRGDIRYEDKQNIDWFEAGFIPSSTRINVRGGVETDSFRIELYVENLTDDRTPLGAQYEPARNEVAAFTGNRGPVNNTGLNVAIATPRQIGVKFGFDKLVCDFGCISYGFFGLRRSHNFFRLSIKKQKQ